jgi:copper chaperone CopZ
MFTRSFIMHALTSRASLVLVSIVAMGCASTQQGASPSASSDSVSTGAMSDKPVAVMVIHGMACPQCSYNVDLQLKKVPGVEKVAVNMALGRVEAWLSPSNPPTRQQLTKAIEETTFTLVSLRMPGEAAAVQ